MRSISPLPSRSQSADTHADMRALLDRAEAFGVVMSRDASAVADVEGLGEAWANATRWWLDFPEPFAHLVLVAQRGELDRPAAFMARDDEALAAVVAVLCERAATLFASCTSTATWQIVEHAVRLSEPARGRA